MREPGTAPRTAPIITKNGENRANCQEVDRGRELREALIHIKKELPPGGRELSHFVPGAYFAASSEAGSTSTLADASVDTAWGSALAAASAEAGKSDAS